MSHISKYRNKIIGYIHCPSDYELIEGSITSKIPVYVLEQDIPADETSFDGKAGDILVGGGNGEAEVMRISMPEAVDFLIKNEKSPFISSSNAVKCYWSHNFLLRLANGFLKVGWDYNKSSLETWLTRQILGWILHQQPSYIKMHVPGNSFSYQDDLF